MEWLESIRVEQGISQIDAAAKIGVSQPFYSNIENGKRRPSVEVAKRIAGLFGFEWTRFFEEG